jgi:hypothetical protein
MTSTKRYFGSHGVTFRLFERASIIKINSPLLTNWSRTWRGRAKLMRFSCRLFVMFQYVARSLPERRRRSHSHTNTPVMRAHSHLFSFPEFKIQLSLRGVEGEGAGFKFVCAAGNTNARIYPRRGRKSVSAILIAPEIGLVCAREDKSLGNL